MPGGTSPANPVTLFEFASGSWTTTGSLNAIHYGDQTTLLNDGTVLLVGGQDSMFGDTIKTTEIYHPTTRAWTTTGDLNTPRSDNTLTRLDGPACRSAAPPAYCGQVLAAGGSADDAGKNTALNTAETYDPVTGQWTLTGNLNAARTKATATLLDGPECHASAAPAYCGEVLIAGGESAPKTLASAELYNPATRQWTTTGSLHHTASLTASVLLQDGRVLLAGGAGSDTTATEIYDPASAAWTATGSLNVGRQRESLVVLKDGQVLTAAGLPPGNLPQLGTAPQAGDTAELYNPTAGTWTLLPGRLIDAARDNMDTALLPDGRVLLAGGGRGGITSELFDPSTDTWSSAGLLDISRGSGNPQNNSYSAVVLSSDPTTFATDAAVCGTDCGKVLVAGNTDDRSAELYTPSPAAPGQIQPPGPFGDATFQGSEGAAPLNKPIVGMAVDPKTGGYWLVASDGGIFTFNAPFLGSEGGTPLNKPIVGMAATPDGGGYYLVASDGGVFTFGDATFQGSEGAAPLNKPIVGMAVDPKTGGYWLVASDGGIFTFNAPFLGSEGGMALNKPVVGMATTPYGNGYYLVASDGGIFALG
ncbi:MAG: kelch repeat-containing protein [Acidimicrobiales bacterium]